MTNERAVEILNLDLDILGQYGGETAEAYKMAIKALEKQQDELVECDRTSEAHPTHGSTYGGVSWGGTYKEEVQSSSNEFFNFDAPMVKNSEKVSSKMCEYCERAKPLVTDKSGDKGISLMYPNTLSAYGYDINGANSNGICTKINYCPMCGRELEDEE